MRFRYETQISERSLRRTVALVLVLLVSAIFPAIAGNPAIAQQPTVIEAIDEPSIATPRGEQILRLAGPVEGPESLDPALARDLGTVFLVRQIFRGLTRLDRNLDPVPELADRIEISPDGLVYRFRLRATAAFHNGRPINADDVVFSIQRAVDPRTAGGDASLLGGPTFLSDIAGFGDLVSGKADELSGISAIDARTVEIRLSAPRSTFLMKLASAPASVVDADEVNAERDWWMAPNGSGPFEVWRLSPGESLILKRFDEYFSGAPPLERIEFALGPSALQSFNLYQAGEIDLDTAPIAAVDRVLAPESGLSGDVTVMPLFNVDYIAFRTDIAPLDDVNIRRAILLAFPREKVASVSYDGYLRAADGVIPHGMLGRNWPVEWPEHDLQAANGAIAASRYGSAERVPAIEIYVSGYAGAESLRDSLKDSLGLEIDVIDVEWSNFAAGLANRRYPAFELYWGADYPDPESMLRMLFGGGAADNYSDYYNPRFDALLDDAAREQDIEERASIYSRAQQMLIDDAVILPLYYDVAYWLKKPYVFGVEFTPLGLLRLESIWLER